MTDAELAIVVKLRDLFTKQLDSIVKNTDTSAKKMESSWKRLTTGIMAAKVAVAGWLTGQAARAIGSTVELAAKVDRANIAFAAMAKRIGIDAPTAILAMREASEGAASDLDLMAAANRAIMLGAVDSVESLKNLTFYGAKLGNAMGLAASQGIDYFTTGLARQSNAILDNVGLLIDLEGEYKKLGKTAADLTEDQRRSIFSAAVWRKAQEAVSTLGSNMASTAMSVDRLSAAWDNLKASVSSAIGPLVEAAARTADLITAPGPGKAQRYRGHVYGAGAIFESKEDIDAMLGPPPTPPLTKSQIEALRAWHKSEQEMDSILQWRETMKQGAYPYRAPTEEDASYVSQVWDAMSKGALRYHETVRDALGLVSTAVYRVFQDIETNLGDVFFDAMMGKMKSFKDYVRAFVQDIGRTLSQLMARQALGAILGAIPGLATPMVSVAGGGSVPLGGAGGVYPAHQAGGITSGPSIAGEAGPEAIVPLPGSRSIPVEFKGGGGGGNVTYIINAIDTQSFASALLGNRATINRLVSDGIGADASLRAAIRAV